MQLITSLPSRKLELMRDILITEHLIDTYSRIDVERVAQLTSKLNRYETELLDIMVQENNTWLENQLAIPKE